MKTSYNKRAEQLAKEYINEVIQDVEGGKELLSLVRFCKCYTKGYYYERIKKIFQNKGYKQFPVKGGWYYYFLFDIRDSFRLNIWKMTNSI